MLTDAQRRAKQKYERQHVKQVKLVMYPTEKDLVEWLEQQPNKAGYIKSLIRSDMEQKKVNKLV